MNVKEGRKEKKGSRQRHDDSLFLCVLADSVFSDQTVTQPAFSACFVLSSFSSLSPLSLSIYSVSSSVLSNSFLFLHKCMWLACMHRTNTMGRLWQGLSLFGREGEKKKEGRERERKEKRGRACMWAGCLPPRLYMLPALPPFPFPYSPSFCAVPAPPLPPSPIP